MGRSSSRVGLRQSLPASSLPTPASASLRTSSKRYSSLSYSWDVPCRARTRARASAWRSVAISRGRCGETLPYRVSQASDLRSRYRCRDPQRRSGERRRNVLSGNDLPDVEVAELGVLRAHLVEAHVGNQLLEVEWVLCEKRYPPLPGVEPDCAGNDLLHPTCVATPGESVPIHQATPLIEL